ncbi:MAG: NAD(P)-dependent oxidoreductase [Verrucomicrobiota bacterium]
MRCLVTGSSGHLGDYLIRVLLEQGHEVVGMVRKESDLWRIKDLLPRISLFYGDLSDLSGLKANLDEFCPEAVFHLAWSGVTASDRDGLVHFQVNLAGTLQLAALAAQAGCRCWVGLGSQAEYGPQMATLTEDMPTWPMTAYGAAKLAACHLSRQICRQHQMRFIWVRLLATYGPKDDSRHLIPSVITQLLQQQTPALTSGNQGWDYLYVLDAAEAICSLAQDTKAEGVFVLGSGESVKVRDIAEIIRDLINPHLELGFGKIPDASGQLRNLCADISKLQAATNWRPKTSLLEGLKRTINWYQSHA